MFTVKQECLLVICIRLVDEQPNVHGEFIGLHPTLDAKADSISLIPINSNRA